MENISNQKTANFNFEELQKFLTETISPADLVNVLELLGHYYSILLIENPDQVPFKETSHHIHILRELRMIIQNVNFKNVVNVKATQ